MRILAAILVTLLVAFAAAVLCYLIAQSPPDDPETVATSPSGDPAYVEELRREVQALDVRMTELENRLALALPEARSGASNPRSGREADRLDVEAHVEEIVTKRLEEIGGELETLRSSIEAQPATRASEPRSLTPDERVVAVEGYEAEAIDPTRSVPERIAALRQLRSLDKRSSELTRAMIGVIADRNVDARYRADVIRNLDGVTYPELRRPLIDSVLNDADPEVREEAAETLGEYLREQDSEIEGVLKAVSERDGANRVRAEAARQLEQFAR